MALLPISLSLQPPYKLLLKESSYRWESKHLSLTFQNPCGLVSTYFSSPISPLCTSDAAKQGYIQHVPTLVTLLLLFDYLDTLYAIYVRRNSTYVPKSQLYAPSSICLSSVSQ